MKRMKVLGLVALAVFAFSAITAAAAQATEGPFYKVGGARLTTTAGIEGSTAKTYVLTAGARTIKCTASKLKSATIVGSTGANAGTSKEIIEFEKCTVAGNGTPCAIPGEKITTEEVKNTLDFANKTSVKGEVLLTYFEPAKETEKEKRFVKITFEGAGCEIKATAVNGSVAAEALETAEKPIKVEEEPAEAEKGFVNFPATAITKDFIEEGGVRKEVKPKLEAFGVKATLEGRTALKLTGGTKWGVYTK